MYARLLEPPTRSFFLFGPRATGKTTWLHEHFPSARFFDLLRADVRLALLKNPSELRRRIEAEPPGSWIVIDEVQQVPNLLTEVHSLIEAKQHRFALSGSSARKLKRGQANLLAGRAVIRRMFPLTAREIADPTRWLDHIDYGTLPLVVTDPDARVDILDAYAQTYLKEEIQAEAAVRDLGAFARFLECTALANAQVTNLSAMARDAAVQRSTVQGYFQILEDTLVGHLLPAWRPRARIKEAAHPKFYWFDSGVARAMSGRIRIPVEREERGRLLETYVLHELRAFSHYSGLGGEIAYWRTPAGIEVDFIWSHGRHHAAIEVKSSDTWKAEFNKGLLAVGERVRISRLLGVYLGGERLREHGIDILPLPQFLQALWSGELLV